MTNMCEKNTYFFLIKNYTVIMAFKSINLNFKDFNKYAVRRDFYLFIYLCTFCKQPSLRFFVKMATIKAFLLKYNNIIKHMYTKYYIFL